MRISKSRLGQAVSSEPHTLVQLTLTLHEHYSGTFVGHDMNFRFDFGEKNIAYTVLVMNTSKAITIDTFIVFPEKDREIVIKHYITTENWENDQILAQISTIAGQSIQLKVGGVVQTESEV